MSRIIEDYRLTLQNPRVDRSDENGEAIEVSVVMPCLNEADTLGICIEKTRAVR